MSSIALDPYKNYGGMFIRWAKIHILGHWVVVILAKEVRMFMLVQV